MKVCVYHCVMGGHHPDHSHHPAAWSCKTSSNVNCLVCGLLGGGPGNLLAIRT